MLFKKKIAVKAESWHRDVHPRFKNKSALELWGSAPKLVPMVWLRDHGWKQNRSFLICSAHDYEDIGNNFKADIKCLSLHSWWYLALIGSWREVERQGDSGRNLLKMFYMPLSTYLYAIYMEVLYIWIVNT